MELCARTVRSSGWGSCWDRESGAGRGKARVIVA